MGAAVGLLDGAEDGSSVGPELGWSEGAVVGLGVGEAVGTGVGRMVGFAVDPGHGPQETLSGSGRRCNDERATHLSMNSFR